MAHTASAERIASTIRAEMARKRISQAELAELLAVSQPAVSRRLSGRVALSVGELVAIANVLDIPLSELVTA